MPRVHRVRGTIATWSEGGGAFVFAGGRIALPPISNRNLKLKMLLKLIIFLIKLNRINNNQI